jgi:hypothetical protein
VCRELDLNTAGDTTVVAEGEGNADPINSESAYANLEQWSETRLRVVGRLVVPLLLPLYLLSTLSRFVRRALFVRKRRIRGRSFQLRLFRLALADRFLSFGFRCARHH